MLAPVRFWPFARFDGNELPKVPPPVPPVALCSRVANKVSSSAAASAFGRLWRDLKLEMTEYGREREIWTFCKRNTYITSRAYARHSLAVRVRERERWDGASLEVKMGRIRAAEREKKLDVGMQLLYIFALRCSYSIREQAKRRNRSMMETRASSSRVIVGSLIND